MEHLSLDMEHQEQEQEQESIQWQRIHLRMSYIKL
jgi:hypothetical protein